jgi:uncharacterized protein (TIGR03086 family)
MPTMNPLELFRAAAARGADVMREVHPGQLTDPTPCAEWTVQQLIDHMVTSTEYLVAAVKGRAPAPRSGTGVSDYVAGATRALAGLSQPGALDRVCMSPLGFEWPLGQATAGTFMDNLIHTWDLATATGQDASLDPVLVEACVAMFLPEMPERGRAAGLVGPAISVGESAPPQDRLLASMGRQP